MLLRLAGLFHREVTAAVIGTVLCVGTLSIFIAAAVLANEDRRSEARVNQNANGTAGEQGENVSESRPDATNQVREAEEGAGARGETRRGGSSPEDGHNIELTDVKTTLSAGLWNSLGLCAAEPPELELSDDGPPPSARELKLCEEVALLRARLAEKDAV